MARRKQVLKSSIDSDVCLIGITCQLKSYRLSFSINKALRFQFRRIDDLEVPGFSGNDILAYPFLVYDHPDLKNLFCLVSNYHPQKKLISSMRQVDYFLVAKTPLDKYTKSSFMEKLRKISQVVAVYEINPDSNKDMDQLLEDLELHILVSNKKRNAARA